MKRYGHLFPQITAFPNLLRACRRAACGKKNKRYVSQFLQNMESNLLCIQRELESETYVWGDYYTFEITDPKPRIISAPSFRDRIVHHAICNVIEPIFDATFIDNSFACRKGKGALAGVFAYEKIIHHHPELVHVLKCDVRKFFPSVDHEVLFALIKRKIKDPPLLRLLHNLIFIDEGKGLPIGNLSSQLFANIMLSPLDHHLKETLKVKHYLRYMDDFMIVHEDINVLRQIRIESKRFLSETLKLTMHPNKQHIWKVENGLDWLGFRIFPNGYKRLRGVIVRRFRFRLKSFNRGDNQQVTDFSSVRSSIASFLGMAKHANTFSLCREIFQECDPSGLGLFSLVRSMKTRYPVKSG